MSQDRLKELLEKLKTLADEKNDEDLKALVASFDPAGDEDGGNHPTNPPGKP